VFEDRSVEGNIWTLSINVTQNIYRNRQTAKPRHMQEDNIKIDFKEIGCFDAD
jgi:hypothetical protein